MKKLKTFLAGLSAITLVGAGYSAFLFEKDFDDINTKTIDAEIQFHPAYEAVASFEFLDDTDNIEVHLDQHEGKGKGIHITKKGSHEYPITKGDGYEIKYQYTLEVQGVTEAEKAEVSSRLQEYDMKITGSLDITTTTNEDAKKYLKLSSTEATVEKGSVVETTNYSDTSLWDLKITATGSYKINVSYGDNGDSTWEPRSLTEYNTMKTALSGAKVVITLTALVSNEKTQESSPQ